MKTFDIEDIQSELKRISEENKVNIMGAFTITPLIDVRDEKGAKVSPETYKNTIEALHGLEEVYGFKFMVEPRLSIKPNENTIVEPITEPIEAKKEKKVIEAKNAKA